MLKKITSIITLIVLFTGINQGILTTYAVDTNETNNPWTIEKATHLAKKTLYGATPEKIQELLNAGNAINAVNILFPSENGPDRNSYNTELSVIGTSDRNKYYMAKKILDPYEAKSKLFLIFEDIFSVQINGGKDITLEDIEETHNMLYDHSLGNYKEMVKRNLYNNGMKADYSLSQFLDLLNQKNPDRPNENYSRELLQLFLMLEYIPTESETTGDERNYSEKDVNALAKIIFGFESDEDTHIVTYNNDLNTNTEIEFLVGDLKIGDSFPFYNTGSGLLDIQLMKQSISGNNGLPDNTIDYIFSKREYEISMFLADKLFRFYIAENPTKAELNQISAELILNNFDIYPTVKTLLASNLMYSQKSMNEIFYKNPIELSIGSIKKLGININDVYTSTLTNLEWTPYYPGTIFGRAGFDENSLFFKANNATKFIREASLLAEKIPLDTFIEISGTGVTATGLINHIQEKLYLGRQLNSDVKEKLIHFLTHDENGNEIVVNIDDTTYQKYYIKGLITLMLIQPEYILQNGYDKNIVIPGVINPFFTTDSKLIIIKSYGGTDWLHNIIPKNEYTEYLEKRSTGSLVGTDLLNLGDEFYINSSMLGFKNLYDNGDLKVINRVGTPNHSRGHDSASRKITSQNNIYDEDDGIIGHFIKNENPVKTMVMGTRKPLELREGKYLNITSNTIYSISDSTTATFRDYKIKVIKDIYNTRTYPENIDEVFKNSVIIDEVSLNSVANGGRPGSGYNMKQNFAFIEGLFDSNITNIVSMGADGGYDTHRNQKEYLTSNLQKVSDATTEYFNKVKNKQDITIVIYSEFGRTTQLNASEGTDHGMGGGMFIISNNVNLQNDLSKKIYGNLSFKDAESNWLGVGIDYRSVYSSIINSLYNVDISNEINGNFEIDDYIDSKESDIELLNINYSNSNRVDITLNIQDTNFHPKEASYIKFEYGTDTNNMYEYSSYYINRYMTLNDDSIGLYISRTTAGTKYYYKITIYDNQYNEKIIEGDFISPILSNDDILEINTHTRLTKYLNTTVSGSLDLTSETSSGIILSNSGTISYSNENSIKLLAGSGTFITELTSSGTNIWNGTFITPISIDKNDFITKKSIFNGYKLLDKKIAKIIKVGSDNLGISMLLNKNVDIEISDIDSTKKYIIISSEDGNKWTQLDNSNIVISNNKIVFKTNHFTFFLVLEIDEDENLIIDNNELIISRTSGGGSPRAIKDICPYGDYSISYYDRTCGIDPTLMDPDYGDIGNLLLLDMYNDSYSGGNGKISEYNKDIEIAFFELKVKEKDKAEVFEKLFIEKEVKLSKEQVEELLNNEIEVVLNNEIVENIENEYISEKKVLILLREGMSSILIDGYKVIYIKNSELNIKFEKIGKLFISKNFSKEKTTKLFNILNKVIIYYAINNLELLEKDIKEKNTLLLKKSIKELIAKFKEKKTRIVPVKKTETIKEKIIRINAKKKILKPSISK